MRKIVLAACVVSWCVGISFSTSGVRGSESVGAASEAKNVPGQIKVLKNSDVLAAVKARTPDASIVATFDRADCEFDISASGLLDLTKNGVSTTVINGMVEAMRKKRAGESITSIGPGGAGPGEIAVPAEKSPEIVRSEMSRDPKIAALPAAQKEAVLKEAAQAVRYCGENTTLSNFFGCECFARKLSAERLLYPDMHDYPTQNLIGMTNYLECAAPPKIERYGRNQEMRLNEFEMKKYPGVTEEMLAQMADCAGKDLVSRFMAKPTDQIAVIDGMVANISYECKKKVEGGIMTRHGVQPGTGPGAAGTASAAAGSTGGSVGGGGASPSGIGGSARGGSAAGAATGPREYGFCYGGEKIVLTETFYFSAIFVAAPGNEVRDAFRNWVAQQNGGKRTGLCSFSKVREDVEAQKEHAKENCQKHLDIDKRGQPMLKTSIVESGWTYGQ